MLKQATIVAKNMKKTLSKTLSYFVQPAGPTISSISSPKKNDSIEANPVIESKSIASVTHSNEGAVERLLSRENNQPKISN